ncbi:MAG: hypothetical protein AVDCRST_MAG10-2000 [uncultured Acidimicrobiales bacterium]|uniref:Uncharacterized protein n=1 Tax=uncultured Acidimicrobiales bacterium TaxID=310071 RepID=A0A6J4IAL9_9ACTN|nr:MAG: hypothetical protein AVDCRST_MAG10-2000 [uncultured Acidimicrobiales bacterium]
MRHRVAMAMAVLAAGLVWAPAPPAAACSIVAPGPTEEELLTQADLVFEGTAVSSRDPNAGSATIVTGDPIFWTFATERTIKGAPTTPQEVGTSRSGASCGFTFQAGSRYRVFARSVGGVYMTSLGSGTVEIVRQTEPTVTTTTTRPPAAAPTSVPPTRTGRIALTG